MGPGPILANRLQAVKQTISASLADVVKRVSGQSKGRAEAREKTGGKPRLEYPIRNYPPAFSRASVLPLRGASRRSTGAAGRPGTAAGVIQSTRGSHSDRRPTQYRGLLLCSFLPSACRRQAKGEQSADCRPQPALPVGSSAGRARRKRVSPASFAEIRRICPDSPFASWFLERE